eukprot:TRINITY_DN1940_c0_g1_i2.p1 TRINITY_DN1940_c0_g1~~TRINITY_DN1940_c0_g1_i2.p1  ORF type:complete len:345 (+),score=55.45 TRINITY_DN1940_c0_g1_i2:47-1036(+)
MDTFDDSVVKVITMPFTNASRWADILRFLSARIDNSHRLFETIDRIVASGRPHGARRWNWIGLEFFLEQTLSDNERSLFFNSTLPFIIALVNQTQQHVPASITVLRQGTNLSISLKQTQCACILACAFLCIFDDDWLRDTRDHFDKAGRHRERLLPTMNFYGLYSHSQRRHYHGAVSQGPLPFVMEKLRCLLHYFERVRMKTPSGLVIFERRALLAPVQWHDSDVPLTNMYTRADGTIEDDGKGMLEVDFANKSIGGGVLGKGCVQEEIRFCINPELIASRLFTEEMLDHEAVVITGTERFCNYSGYRDKFAFAGNHTDNTVLYVCHLW